MKTVGIIGFGSFGKFLAEKLSSHAKVMVYSQSGRESSWMGTIEEVAACDYVIPAIPLDAYEQMLRSLKPHLRSETVVVDVCSVKIAPVDMLRRVLPHQPIVATHPMFGPESASVSFAGHTFVMCPEVSSAKPYEAIKHFANSLGLGVVEMSTEEHDREIAVVQGLTFFIGRALNDMHIHDQKLFTPSFERLLKLAELEQHHSAELFRTIQTGNVYVSPVRQRFIEAIIALNDDLRYDQHR